MVELGEFESVLTARQIQNKIGQVVQANVRYIDPNVVVGFEHRHDHYDFSVLDEYGTLEEPEPPKSPKYRSLDDEWEA